MRSYHVHKTWMIYCSFGIAILLQCFCSCLIEWYFFRPSCAMMSLIYWVMVSPHKVNIGTGFFLGLIIDCIFGSICGVCSLSFSIISYLTVRKVYFFRNASILQQSCFVLFLSLINQSITFLIKCLMTQILFAPEFFWIVILDGILWPFLILLMRKIYHY